MSRIQNNVMAANTHRMYSKNNNAVSKSAEKLSSGYRINRAGDDAAGLAISEKMRAQIRGLNMASKNSNDAISMVQTAEGALQEAHTMLQRMNELAVQSASDTNVEIDRNALQLEFENLQEEIDQIAETTKFNDTVLLDGSMGVGSTGATAVSAGGAALTGINVSGPAGKTATITEVASSGTKGITAAFDNSGNLTFTVDAAAADTFTADDFNKALASAANAPANAKDYKVTIGGSGTVAAAANSTAQAGTAVTMAKAAQATTSNVNGVSVTMNTAGVNAKTVQITAAAGTVGATVQGNNGNVLINLDATKSYTASEINGMLKDAGADMSVSFSGTKTTADITAGFSTATAVGAALAASTGSNTAGAGLAGGGGMKIQVGAEEGHTLDLSIGSMDTNGLGITKAMANVGNRDDAEKAITTSRDAINKISTQRATLGAIQNRLEYKISALDITAENLQAAEGRIRDVDMAKEMTAFTKNNILSQASTAMLAQANASPQNVLQLLG